MGNQRGRWGFNFIQRTSKKHTTTAHGKAGFESPRSRAFTKEITLPSPLFTLFHYAGVKKRGYREAPPCLPEQLGEIHLQTRTELMIPMC